MRIEACPVCQLQLTNTEPLDDIENHRIKCDNCGQFRITSSAVAALSRGSKAFPEFPAILSHRIRRLQHANEWPLINSYFVSNLDSSDPRLPTPQEQCENLVVALGEKLRHPGATEELPFATSRAEVGAVDEDGVRFVVNALEERGLVVAHTYNQGANISLSLDGWEAYSSLVRGTSTGRQAFMAMEFSNEALQKIFLEHFKPATEATGFELVRLDEAPKAGSIDERLRVEIRRSAFLVADLTDANAGAYWEAGFAEGLGKPVIYTCSEGAFKERGTHFDTNHLHTVLWDSESPQRAALELKCSSYDLI